MNITGLGMSSIARDKTTYFNKTVLHRYADAPRGKLWDAFGAKSHELAALQLLPDTTTFACAGDVDLELLWNWLTSSVAASGIPELQQGFMQVQSQMQEAGIDLNRILASIDQEMGIVLTIDEAETFSFEGPTGPMQIPSLSLMLITKVKDDALFKLIDKNLPPDMPIERTDSETMRRRTMTPENPLPMLLEPSVVLSNNYLMLATNGVIIDQAMATLEGKRPGLTAGDEFKRLSQDVPNTGVSFHFISSRFTQQLRKVAEEMAKAMPPEQGEMMSKMLENHGEDMFSYGVTEHRQDGFYFTGNANSGIANSLLMAGAVAPAAVMAGMLMPALSQSREKARRAHCANNLKQIGIACIIYAGDNEGNFPNNFQQLADQEYLSAGKVWSCPAHGEPTLDPSNSHYVYLGKRLADSVDDPNRTVLAYEKPDNHPGSQWINVLFVDGHVQGVPGPSFKEAAKRSGWIIPSPKKRKRVREKK